MVFLLNPEKPDGLSMDIQASLNDSASVDLIGTPIAFG